MKSIWRNKIWPANLLLAAGAAFSGAAHAVNDLPGGPSVRQLNLPVGVTKIAQEQHFLHNMMMILCTVIFIAVFGSCSIRSSSTASRWATRRPTSMRAVVVEIIWTIVPFVIVILMALPATRVLVARRTPANSDLTIKATGYQWKWGYDYLKGEGEGICLHLDARYGAARDVRRRQATGEGRRLPAQGRQPAGRAGQQEGAHHHDGGRRDPRLRRAGASASSRTRSPASCATRGFAPSKSATSTASAPSCAARSTRSCRST